MTSPGSSPPGSGFLLTLCECKHLARFRSRPLPSSLGGKGVNLSGPAGSKAADAGEGEVGLILEGGAAEGTTPNKTSLRNGRDIALQMDGRCLECRVYTLYLGARRQRLATTR
jgi:hypothetical protein